MSRSLLIFGLCIPLAILMGFMLSDPLVSKNMMVVGSLAGLMLLPLFINFHHVMLIWTANMYMNAFFVKGQPQVWMLMGVISLTLSILSRPLAKVKPKPLWTPGLAASLLFIGLVALVTAKFRGGIGLMSFGSSTYGGKRYIFIWLAIIGFFALTMHALPRNRVKRDVSIFAMGQITAAFSNFAYMLGPYFYFLFLLFPVTLALGQAAADMSGYEGFKRITGFGPASVGVTCFCLARWGLKGMLNVYKPWRMAIPLMAMGLGLLSGFRSNLALCLLLFVAHFFAEGLHRTRYLAGFLGLMVGVFAFLTLFSEKLPITAQRAISFLPVRVDAAAARDAQNSTKWRLEMWSVLVNEIPKYLWLGKGYAIDPTDLYLAQESFSRGFATDHEFSMQAGDYHSGPLSLIIPLGIWGVLGFLWFLFCCVGVLWKNYKNSEPEFQLQNTFLFAFFLARVIFFFFFFGAFEQDLWALSAIAGLSLCINGGVKETIRGEPLKFKAEKKNFQRRELEPAGA